MFYAIPHPGSPLPLVGPDHPSPIPSPTRAHFRNQVLSRSNEFLLRRHVTVVAARTFLLWGVEGGGGMPPPLELRGGVGRCFLPPPSAQNPDPTESVKSKKVEDPRSDRPLAGSHALPS